MARVACPSVLFEALLDKPAVPPDEDHCRTSRLVATRFMMPLKSNFAWKLAAILAVALVLRLAAGWWWQERLPAGVKFGFGDSESYWELGRAIARGEPYEYGPDNLKIFRTPGYPALLAP